MDTVSCFATYRDLSEKIAGSLRKIPPDLLPSRIVLAWEHGGLLTPAWTGDTMERLWLNVAAHQAATGVLAYALASRLRDKLEKGRSSTCEVVEAALIHDAFKRREYEIIQAAKREGHDQRMASIEAEVAGSKFLFNLGFNENVIRLAKTTGDLGVQHLFMGNATLAEKLVFYADRCVSNFDIVGYKKRADDILPYFEPGCRYYYVQELYLAQYGKTHRKVLDSVVLPIEAEIASAIRFEGKPADIYTIAL